MTEKAKVPEDCPKSFQGIGDERCYACPLGYGTDAEPCCPFKFGIPKEVRDAVLAEDDEAKASFDPDDCTGKYDPVTKPCCICGIIDECPHRPAQVEVLIQWDDKGRPVCVWDKPNNYIRLRAIDFPEQWWVIRKVPKSSCKRCYGRGVVGLDAKTKAPVFCGCTKGGIRKVPKPNVKDRVQAIIEGDYRPALVGADGKPIQGETNGKRNEKH